MFERPKFDAPWGYYYTTVQYSSLNGQLSKEYILIYNLGINAFGESTISGVKINKVSSMLI